MILKTYVVTFKVEPGLTRKFELLAKSKEQAILTANELALANEKVISIQQAFEF